MKNQFLTFFLILLIYSGAHCQKIIFTPDTTVNNGLILLNKNSIINTIGDQSGKLIQDAGPSRVIFKNANSTEYLIIYHLEGSNANRFNEFEIGKLDSNEEYEKINVTQFKTENGVKLGITRQNLIRIKGKPTKEVSENGYFVLSYVIKDVNSSLLRKENMPEYSAVYYFRNDRLDKFIFGFPNL